MRTQAGFTLLELMLVVVIAGILATVAEPIWEQAATRAREAALKQTLFTLREILDQYRADRGKYPPTLAELAREQYLRKIPDDPFTRTATTWQEISDDAQGGIVDVHSGSPLVGLNGTPYNEW